MVPVPPTASSNTSLSCTRIFTPDSEFEEQEGMVASISDQHDGMHDIRALRQPNWSPIRLELHDRLPHFVIQSSLVAWNIDDVVAMDASGFSRFCANFTQRSRFLRGCENAEFVGRGIPFYPPSLVPGRCKIMSIHDMELLRGTWVVILRIEALVSSNELMSGSPDISGRVVEWLSHICLDVLR
ncbi:unnamed protein product [Discula destructiva]